MAIFDPLRRTIVVQAFIILHIFGGGVIVIIWLLVTRAIAYVANEWPPMDILAKWELIGIRVLFAVGTLVVIGYYVFTEFQTNWREITRR